jgi:hypothetical protein
MPQDAPCQRQEPSTLNPQPSTLNPQPSTLNPQPSTLNPQPTPHDALSRPGGQPDIKKKEKVVLLVGYMADRFESKQGVEYIAQHGCIGEVCADTTGTDP